MALYATAHYQVKPEAIQKVKMAIEEFTRHVRENEPGTEMHWAWQQKNNLGYFMHFFIFENEAAKAIHSTTAAVKKFGSIYSPELVGGKVVFTEYNLVASNTL